MFKKIFKILFSVLAILVLAMSALIWYLNHKGYEYEHHQTIPFKLEGFFRKDFSTQVPINFSSRIKLENWKIVVNTTLSESTLTVPRIIEAVNAMPLVGNRPQRRYRLNPGSRPQVYFYNVSNLDFKEKHGNIWAYVRHAIKVKPADISNDTSVAEFSISTSGDEITLKNKSINIAKVSGNIDQKFRRPDFKFKASDYLPCDIGLNFESSQVTERGGYIYVDVKSSANFKKSLTCGLKVILDQVNF